MTHRTLTHLVAAALAVGLGGCSADESRSSGVATNSTPTTTPAGAAQPAPAKPRNHIELVVNGETFVANSASSFGNRYQGDPNNPLYDVSIASGWVGNADTSIVELDLLNLDGRSRTVILGGDADDAPVLRLANIPGHKGRYWRSTSGTVNLEFDDDAFGQPGTGKLRGRFQATVRAVHSGNEQPVEGGEVLAVSGSFDFTRDMM